MENNIYSALANSNPMNIHFGNKDGYYRIVDDLKEQYEYYLSNMDPSEAGVDGAGYYEFDDMEYDDWVSVPISVIVSDRKGDTTFNITFGFAPTVGGQGRAYIEQDDSSYWDYSVEIEQFFITDTQNENGDEDSYEIEDFTIEDDSEDAKEFNSLPLEERISRLKKKYVWSGEKDAKKVPFVDYVFYNMLDLGD